VQPTGHDHVDAEWDTAGVSASKREDAAPPLSTAQAMGSPAAAARPADPAPTDHDDNAAPTAAQPADPAPAHRGDDAPPATQPAEPTPAHRGDDAPPATQPAEPTPAHRGDDAPPATQPIRTPRATFRRLSRALTGQHPAEAVYGTITVAALLAAESSLRETYLETVGSVALAMLLYWLGHSYADLLGHRIQAGERLTARELGRMLIRDWAIVRGAGAPLLALLIMWAVGASQQTAVTVGLWTCVVSLVAFELIAGLRARARPAELVLELSVGIAMGVGVIALRAILH
jgi:hypothetical protein